MTTTEALCTDALAMAQVCASLAAVLADAPTEHTAATVARLASALDVDCPGTDALPTLARDHAELFVVPNPRYVAPYESVYRDPCDGPPGAPTRPSPPAGAGRKGLLMGPTTFEVRRVQLEAGLVPERDLPDHVANELWFVAHLWRKEAQAPESERADWAHRREHFTNQHLRQWLPDLAAAVRRHQQGGLYGTALEVALAVIELE